MFNTKITALKFNHIVYTKITALKFNHIVYRKKRRGAGLDKLILLCPLKLLITFFVP